MPLAFFASAASLSAHHSDPHNSAETAFLGLLATVVLCGLGAVDRRPHFILAGTAVLSALTLWALPAGDARGAAVSLVLAAGVCLATYHRLLADGTEALAGSAVGLAIAAQALFRPEIWLAPGRLPVIAFEAILLPVAAGLASARLTTSRGLPLLLGVTVAVSLQRGVSPELALVLVVLAAIETAREHRKAAIPWAAVGAAILFTYRSELALLLGQAGNRTQIAEGLARFLILFPAIPMAARRRLLAVTAALLLAVGGLWLLPADAALIVPILLIVGCLRRDSLELGLQATWSLTLATGAALTAGYPWLRIQPIDSVLTMLALEAGWRSALIVAAIFGAVVILLVGLKKRAAIKQWKTSWSVGAAATVIGCGLLIAVSPTFRTLLPNPVVLSASQPAHEMAVTGPTKELFVDSYVSNGLSVAPGTPLATISLESPNGTTRRLVLRAGADTGEWAAERPGVNVTAPPPWISWLAPDGPYFAQRYRTHRRFELATAATKLHLRRLEDLPDELELAVFQIGVRP